MSNAKKTPHFACVIIGGGSGGYAAARTAAGLGLKTAVIDGAETLAGLCILRGCMPSKTLIESSNRARAIRDASEFGIHVSGPVEVRPREIIARKRRLIREFADYRREQLENGDFTLIRGNAAFTSAATLTITPGDGVSPALSDIPGEITFDTCIVATGSTINIPQVPGLESMEYLTSDDVLDREDVPGSLIVLGGGPIALELAQYHEGIGSRVTVIQRSERVLKELDEDLTRVLEKGLVGRGITLFTGTELRSVRQDGSRKIVEFLHRGEAKTAEADAILVATGRRPDVGKLQLEAAGIKRRSGGGMAVDLQMRSSVPHVFGAGDVCSPYEVVHIAIEQGEIAARNAAIHVGRLDASVGEMDYRLKLLGIFTDPEIASVGFTEREAAERGLDCAAATHPFDDHGKSMVGGHVEGFVKLIADKTTGEIVGGSVVGPHAVDLIHEVVVAMRFCATAGQLAAIPHYHPTLSEIWTYPAEELS